MPVRLGPHPPLPQGWRIATDGSGKWYKVRGKTITAAGWGAVVFREPLEADGAPDFVLHAPVVTADWDHLWMGARVRTNNTGELSAIGEVMMWLLNECPDDGHRPVLLRYDSEYAANMARGAWSPASNEELIRTIRGLVEQVSQNRVITWEHVYSHTGQHDNELADQAADGGANGQISNMSARWAAPPPPPATATRVTRPPTARGVPKAKAKGKAKGRGRAKPKAKAASKRRVGMR